jgi:hypothetical protein
MKNTIICGISIVAVSALLISVMMFHAEAKTFDKNAEYELKGLGIAIFGTGPLGTAVQAQIFPIANSKEVSVEYGAFDNDGVFSMGFCTSPKQILKVSGTNKASIQLNTADLDCFPKVGVDSVITATVYVKDLPVFNDKYDQIRCQTVEDVDFCIRDRGSQTLFGGIGNISGFGLSLDNQFAHLEDVKFKRTQWTSP